MKKTILVAIIGAMTLGVNAGDWGKAPIAPKAPVIEECYDIGGEISSGYMTDYIFYGVRFARDSVWTDVNYTFDNLMLPVNIGAWYLNSIKPTGTTVDELDLYASVELGAWSGIDFSLGYVHYFFPESGFPSYGEIGLDAAINLGFADLVAETNYALLDDRFGPGGGGGWYHQIGLERTFFVTDAVSLVLGAGVGYSDGYFSSRYYGLVPNPNTPRGSGWNHYYVTASLPIELNCRATLTPYIGYNGGPDTWIVDGVDAGTGVGAQSDILHGGVSLSVSF
ncbi:MAG: hypothetical protein WD342_03185 [Verrucomicrobiales bacterium]